MKIYHNLQLSDFSTMHLGGEAAHVAEVTNRSEVAEAVNWTKQQNLPAIMVGSGSNIVWKDGGFNGLLLVNKITGYEDFAEDEENHYLTIGAGEIWDGVVRRSVSSGLTGIEALSLVPGCAGATPIQNVGAYGQEISQTLTSIEAFDTATSSPVTIPGFEANFSYRNSRFKTGPDRNRFLILSLTLHLTKANPLPPFYPSVQNYFDQHNIASPTPADMRRAVIEIRQAKLPNPNKINNCGSFFANPVVDKGTLVQIEADHGPCPNWDRPDGKVKLSAAWLIEKAGFKGIHDKETGMATWTNQPLVFVNERAGSTADLLAFKKKITDTVAQKFHINLTQEPELLP